METNEVQPINRILACDRAANPSSWLDIETAVHLLTTGRVLASLGEHRRVVFGGVNARSGRRSRIELSSILLTSARVREHRWHREYQAPLSNRALFARDGHLCLYCGHSFAPRQLTRDHIVPLSRGGLSVWSNLASACRPCNQRKNNRTPAEWGTELIAVPYAPCHAEHLILSGRVILADQMAFLRARLRHNAIKE